MRLLGYSLTIAVNCFFLFALLYVLAKLNNSPEALVLAVLGLMYAGIRANAIRNIIFNAEASVQIHRQLFYVRKLLKDPSHDMVLDDFEQQGKVKDENYAKLYIDGFFLLLISLVCLFVIFASNIRS
jgi:hypothetical protein